MSPKSRDRLELKGSLDDHSTGPIFDEEKGGNLPANLESEEASNLAFTIPDGGWRAWSVVLGSTLALFVSFGYVSFSHFISELRETYLYILR